MAVYLLLSWVPSLLTGNFQSIEALATIRAWALYFWSPWLLLAGLVRVWLQRFPFVPEFGLRTAVRFVAALLVLLLSHAALILLILQLPANNPVGTADAGTLLFREGYALLDIVLFTLLAAGSSFRALRSRVREHEQQAWSLNRNLADAKLQTLKMQLNPHFLFNTLNGLAVLIDKQQNEQARAMLGELSSFLRQTLRNSKEKWVTLDRELEFVKQYLKIEQYRFGKRLTYFEECEPLALAARIPPLLLQPLFENAIVHGLADKEGECRIGFECRLYDRWLILMIFDNGNSFDDTADLVHEGGIGLANVRGRLQEIYGANNSLGIEKRPDGTLVTLKIPAYKDSQF